MELTTQRDLILKVAKRWHEQYDKSARDTILFSDRMGITRHKSIPYISAELDALNKETATAEDVDRIIGNSAWTTNRCDECKRDVDAVVMLGDKPDYESNTARVCRDCLVAALALINSR